MKIIKKRKKDVSLELQSRNSLIVTERVPVWKLNGKKRIEYFAFFSFYFGLYKTSSIRIDQLNKVTKTKPKNK